MRGSAQAEVEPSSLPSPSQGSLPGRLASLVRAFETHERWGCGVAHIWPWSESLEAEAWLQYLRQERNNNIVAGAIENAMHFLGDGTIR